MNTQIEQRLLYINNDYYIEQYIDHEYQKTTVSLHNITDLISIKRTFIGSTSEINQKDFELKQSGYLTLIDELSFDMAKLTAVTLIKTITEII